MTREEKLLEIRGLITWLVGAAAAGEGTLTRLRAALDDARRKGVRLRPEVARDAARAVARQEAVLALYPQKLADWRQALELCEGLPPGYVFTDTTGG